MDDKALLAAIENIMDRKLEPINTRLDRLEHGQDQMRGDIIGLKQGQEQMREDIVGLKQGQEQIREDIADVKLDIKLLWDETKIIEKRIAVHEKEWHSA